MSHIHGPGNGIFTVWMLAFFLKKKVDKSCLTGARGAVATRSLHKRMVMGSIAVPALRQLLVPPRAAGT